ncbi:TPA: DNA replication terminus site-binding protein [Photobacterium damselae]
MPRNKVRIKRNLQHLKFQLDSEIDSLVSLLRQLELLECRVYTLPLVKSENTHNIENCVKVKTITGLDAFNLAINSYSKFEKDLGASGKRTYRLPGCIIVSGNNHEKIELHRILETINSLKVQFRNEVQSIGSSRKDKFELIHDTFKNLVTIQLYRGIPFTDKSVDRLNFSWSNKYITSKTSINEILALLQKQINHIPRRTNKEDWARLVQKEIEVIQQLPKETLLRIKRPTKPIIRSDMVCDNVTRQLVVNTPLILFQNKIPAISDLQDYLIDQRRSFREDITIYGNPILKRLHLYQKHPVI